MVFGIQEKILMLEFPHILKYKIVILHSGSVTPIRYCSNYAKSSHEE